MRDSMALAAEPNASYDRWCGCFNDNPTTRLTNTDDDCRGIRRDRGGCTFGQRGLQGFKAQLCRRLKDVKGGGDRSGERRISDRESHGFRLAMAGIRMKSVDLLFERSNLRYHSCRPFDSR